MPHPVSAHGHRYATPRRAALASACVIGVTLATAMPLCAQQAAPVTPAQVDSLRQRVEDAEAALQALREQLSTEASSALRTRSRVSLEFTGRALMHLVRNDGRTNNVDVPTFARADSGNGPQGGLAMTIRQTTLGLAFQATEVLGGTFTGDLDVDFFGGQQPSSGGRTFPLVRLRTARAQLGWTHGFVLAGQEQPLITGLDPVSLASVGTPGFAGAGNLWLWLPQLRAGVHTAGRVRVGLEGAVLAPTSGDPAAGFDTQFDPAERTGTPFVQGAVRLEWGEEERRGTVTVGLHHGEVLDGADATHDSKAVAVSARVPLGARLELRGEWYEGQLVRGLGGGAVGQAFGTGGAPVRTAAHWLQANVQAAPRILLGAGWGVDLPKAIDLPPARERNAVTEAHVHWRPAGPLVLGLEWRSLATRYAAGTATTQHLNLAVGFEF